jgi:hypothetical protein
MAEGSSGFYPASQYHYRPQLCGKPVCSLCQRFFRTSGFSRKETENFFMAVNDCGGHRREVTPPHRF